MRIVAEDRDAERGADLAEGALDPGALAAGLNGDVGEDHAGELRGREAHPDAVDEEPRDDRPDRRVRPSTSAEGPDADAPRAGGRVARRRAAEPGREHGRHPAGEKVPRASGTSTAPVSSALSPSAPWR